MSEEETKEAVQRYELRDALDALHESFLETLTKIQQAHPNLSMEEILRDWSGMSEKQVKAFKKNNPGMFRSLKRKKK